MTECLQIEVQRPGDEKIALQAKLIDLDHDGCRLSVPWPVGAAERSFDASDFYECLRAFRRLIEPEGFRVLCEGARPNVFPSGMSGQSGALKCYRHTLGQPAFTKDLLDTFGPVLDVASVGTVEEQDDFIRRHWEGFGRAL
jgi:hypothetical protein